MNKSEYKWAVELAISLFVAEIKGAENVLAYGAELSDRDIVKLTARISRYKNAIRILQESPPEKMGMDYDPDMLGGSGWKN